MKNEILGVRLKDKSCNRPEGLACNLIKKGLQDRCFPVNIPKVLGVAFL